jgi:hypothetical protein
MSSVNRARRGTADPLHHDAPHERPALAKMNRANTGIAALTQAQWQLYRIPLLRPALPWLCDRFRTISLRSGKPVTCKVCRPGAPGTAMRPIGPSGHDGASNRRTTAKPPDLLASLPYARRPLPSCMSPVPGPAPARIHHDGAIIWPHATSRAVGTESWSKEGVLSKTPERSARLAQHRKMGA